MLHIIIFTSTNKQSFTRGLPFVIVIALSVFLLFTPEYSLAQSMWSHFSSDDFAARRGKVMERIDGNIAILWGAELPEGYIQFRQDNTFYYLSGVEVPDAIMILNGKLKTSTLFITQTPEEIRQEAIIRPGEAAAKLYKFTEVVSKDQFIARLEFLAQDCSTFFLQMSPEETASMSRDRCMSLRAKRRSDSFDGRIAKEEALQQHISKLFPAVVIKDLTPIIDAMRLVKDEKEIAVLRECGKIASLGMNEAIKVTMAGIFEYQLVAACDFIYKIHGVSNPGYYAIAASGERTLMMHYNANNHLLEQGTVVLLDYGPDFKYYVTDLTRTWPVSGKFNPVQSKFYQCIKDARNKMIAAMKPGVTYDDLAKIGKAVYENHGLGRYWSGYVGHFVGMSVHDVGRDIGGYDQPFVPGIVFNIEPMIEDTELKIHLRLEDTIVITLTGSENLTNNTPVEPEEIYKLMKAKGVTEE